ncbi:hypothetical protein O6H91_15G045300 [Diphasiastrum complanatum]|uniref:Uncharacterized protein n=1 Tax=Diphasiastrum complanatum TaxID=34168 RepID=A0ACC2BHV9_DIPCM|nr:hypothetical protein O6H91_Y424300 [Diphasiastrum complanatum]KAJ7529336.1 hypothetical protein O6H91_15G045300 [Diphasiastrum complanatum]
MTVEFVTVDSDEEVSLKVRVFRPDGIETQDIAIVLVHQYTFVGGNQGLLKGLAHELASKGYVCVTFDMRGAGRSTGRPSLSGTEEVQDVVTVCRWAAAHLPAPRILVSGISVGATISGAAIDQVDQVIGYVGLGYPFGWLGWLFFRHHQEPLLKSDKPKLFIMGARDGLTSVRQLKNALRFAAGRIRTYLVPNVGHFQMERPYYDATLADQIAEFASTLE